MNAQLNIRISSDLKAELRFKCQEEGIPMEVVVTNLIADYVGEDRYKIIFEQDTPALIPPMEPAEGWCPEIDGVSFAVVSAWLRRHSEKDTSVEEVWHHCFNRIRRKRRTKDTRMIGAYLQRNGWSKTLNPTSAYRVNRLHGRSTVFLKIDQDQSDGLLV